MKSECEACGGRFTPKRASARFCSDRCRKRAARAPEPAPERRTGAAVISITDLTAANLRPTSPDPAASSSSLTSTTEQALLEADRLDTPHGQAALLLARVLDTPAMGQTGSSIASLVREHRAALAAAVAGAVKTESPLERLRGRDRARRVGGA